MEFNAKFLERNVTDYSRNILSNAEHSAENQQIEGTIIYIDAFSNAISAHGSAATSPSYTAARSFATFMG